MNRLVLLTFFICLMISATGCKTLTANFVTNSVGTTVNNSNNHIDNSQSSKRQNVNDLSAKFDAYRYTIKQKAHLYNNNDSLGQIITNARFNKEKNEFSINFLYKPYYQKFFFKPGGYRLNKEQLKFMEYVAVSIALLGDSMDNLDYKLETTISGSTDGIPVSRNLKYDGTKYGSELKFLNETFIHGQPIKTNYRLSVLRAFEVYWNLMRKLQASESKISARDLNPIFVLNTTSKQGQAYRFASIKIIVIDKKTIIDG